MEIKIINTHPVKRFKSNRPVINVPSTFIPDSRLHKHNYKYNIHIFENNYLSKYHRFFNVNATADVFEVGEILFWGQAG